MRLFAACAPGLEPLVREELLALGAAAPTTVPGGIEFDGDDALLYRCNLSLGCALKVLVRLGSFRARRFDELVAKAAALPFSEWLPPDRAVHIRAVCRRSKLYHSGAVAERVRAAIGPRPDHTPALDVHVRLERDRCEISVDTSGEPLHKRGYRLATGKAPLREDLAHALILLSGWDRRSPLIDPFCGAGTIAIEAARLAAGTPPGIDRSFAFMHAPRFDPALFDRVRAAAPQIGRAPRVLASDRDAGAIEAAAANAARARVALELTEAALGRAPAFIEPPSQPGAVITNPPFGHRIGRADTLRNLYQTLGTRVAALPGRWHIAVLVASMQAARWTRLPLHSALMTDHGGSKVYVAIGET